ncbi:MAG: hypothetical protein IKZ82_00620 [Clostridia bacterium]|nr:hypothetical protein [Clostridia bacterium]
MEKQLKTAFAAALALMMALALVHFSALPSSEAKAEAAPTWTVPEGYNEHDYNKIVAFLEQTDENGVKNGTKLSETYDPNDLATWGSEYVDWMTYYGSDDQDSEQRIERIISPNKGLCGSLDLSGCTAFRWLDCNLNSLTELDLSDCPALKYLDCGWNSLTELNVSGCTALEFLDCIVNSLTKLDLSDCPALSGLVCSGNRLTELDISNSPKFPYDHIRAEGNGYFEYDFLSNSGYIRAYPMSGAGFDGFYDESGVLISEGSLDSVSGTYYYGFNADCTGNVIVRFSEGAAPTPDPSEAPVNPSDAPVNPSEAPVNPSEAPVNPSEAPADPSEAPANPTDAPANPSDAPADPTPAPTAAPNPPATGTVALAGVGIAAIIGGIGVAVARRKRER